MFTYIRHLFEEIRGSYWLIPSVLATLAIAASEIAYNLDGSLSVREIPGLGWIYVSDIAAARSILSIIASTTIAVATVSFSVTIVTLSLATAQFGAQLLRNFVQDTRNQMVLGALIATFIYCLLLQRRIEGSAGYAPDLSVTLAICAALVDAFLFIFFIHNITASIQIDNIVANAANKFLASIDRICPDAPRETAIDPGDFGLPSDIPLLIPSRRDGYVEAIATKSLIALASERRAVIELLCRPGHFVVRGTPVARVWTGEPGDDECAACIANTFILGERSSSEEDIEFAVRQLTQVAVRALSPGVNDPNTANLCVDHLGAGLARLASRSFPDPRLLDDKGVVRVIQNQPEFAGICGTAFDTIRQYGSTSVNVTIHLLETLTKIAYSTWRDAERETLRRQAIMVRQGLAKQGIEGPDQNAVEERYERLMGVLSAGHEGFPAP